MDKLDPSDVNCPILAVARSIKVESPELPQDNAPAPFVVSTCPVVPVFVG